MVMTAEPFSETAPGDRPSPAVEDYLKTIHGLEDGVRRVSPQAIAARLGVTPPSVTGMLKRLGDAGFIDYRSGEGALLTSSGRLEARRVIRRHRLIELFLTRALGLDWSEVDAEAEALEHSLSPRLERAIAQYLGEPIEDPHGHPIPTASGDLVQRSLRSLATFTTGQRVLIREARDDSPELLRRWQDLGLMPGQIITFLSCQPLDDLHEINVGNRVLTMGSEGLHGLLGELAPEN